jgi:2-iminobutanoate/2-iminopropanoate deaminase
MVGATAASARDGSNRNPEFLAVHRRDFIQLSVTTALAMAGPGCTHRTTMQHRPIHPVPGLAYAQAVEISAFKRLLFISGQVPADADGNVPADYPSQYRIAWANIERQLKAADMTFDNLVKVTIFLSERRYVQESAGLRPAVLGDRSPAITIVITGIYDQAWLLEIEAIAAA